MVQVTLPDGTSAALPPERAYFDAWAMQELENNLKHIAGVLASSAKTLAPSNADAALAADQMNKEQSK
jgi:hypothetical protein